MRFGPTDCIPNQCTADSAPRVCKPRESGYIPLRYAKTIRKIRPKEIETMAKSMTLKKFQEKFATDDICLDHLFKTRYGIVTVCPKCGQYGTFHKLANMPAYTCNCGHHIHPMAGTPFQSTRTPLTTWFQVMYLFTSSRNGVSAKEVQRLTGVTYKTAWRMCNLIRQYMGWLTAMRP